MREYNQLFELNGLIRIMCHDTHLFDPNETLVLNVLNTNELEKMKT